MPRASWFVFGCGSRALARELVDVPVPACWFAAAQLAPALVRIG
jgi:hypothetical protein